MKINRWMRLVAFVLVLAMMFQMLPVQALALDGVSSVPFQEYEPEAEEPYSLSVLGEVESLREEKIKHFRLSDGSFVAVSYGMPVHYQDSDGQWQDIDNSLLLEADTLKTANKSAPTAFSENLTGGDIFTATQGDFSVSMSLLDSVEPVDMTPGKVSMEARAQEQIEPTVAPPTRVFDRSVEAAVTDEVPTMLQLQEKYVWDVQDVIPEKLQSSLVYRDVFPGIDLLYTAFGYNIKEQIVVNEPQSAYRFDFLLETNGLTAVLNEDGSVTFLDEEGEAHYEIPTPYMVDAIGVYSDKVSFALKEDARGYILTVEADEEWINDEDREFPVNIDPTLAVISGQALQDIYSVYTMEAAPNDTTLGRQWLYVGAQPYSTSNDGRYRIYMHFQNMPSIPSGSEVVHADLSLYKTAYTQRYCPQFPIGAYEVTTPLPSSYSSYYNWFANMTWRRDQPTYDTTNAIDFAFGKTGKEYLHWNLTELVKKWYIEGTDNTTIALAMMNEDEIDTYYYFASATFYAYAGSIPPILTVSYRNNTGIEPYYTYRTMGAGEAGTAYVADATGQLKIAKELVSYASNTNPFSLNLVYNSDYFSSSSVDYNPLTQLGLSMSVGSGWTLDCVQKITAETISGVSYLKYADGDGTIHYFCKDSSRDASYYYDEDGLGLKIKSTGTNAYAMSDDKGNEWIFTGNFLTSTKDSDGNVFNINYSNGKITTITQVNNGQYTITVAVFTYSGNTLTSVTDKAGNVYTLTYSGTKLTGVQRGTTKLAEYLYDGGDSRVTRMADSESGYGIDFTYGTGKLSGYGEVVREKSGAMYHYGKTFSITYPAHSETMYRDNGQDRIPSNYDDLITHYLFDYSGRTVNAYTTDVKGNIWGASNAVYTNNSGTNRKNNRTERTATIGTAGQQVLKNPGVETVDNPWVGSPGFSVSTEKSRTGLKSLKVTASSASDQFVCHDSEPLEEGVAYTFSCFVNTSEVTNFSGKGIYLFAADSDHLWKGEPICYATSPTIDDGWVRISLYFVAYSSEVHTLYLRTEGVTGTFYADDFQLEKGYAPSTFNLVENGSMEMVGHAWVTGTNANFVYGTDLGVANSKMSMRIVGDPEESGTNAYQDIPLNLPASQTYVLSGWAKANAVPDSPEELNSPDDVTKKCGLRATIYYTDGTTEGHYVPFNSDISNQWQFTSTTIVPKKATGTVEKIRVTLAYEGNANTCFFDNISLLREVAQTMRYDADGNLESVTTSGLAEDTNTYANGNLIQTVTGGNGTFTYSYDTTNTHRLNSVTNGQITQSMGYDASGNVISSTLSGTGGKSIQTSAVYQGSQNRITSSKDAAGNETKYYYANGNVQMRALPTTIIDPKGTHHTASYDASGRILQTAVANAANLQYNYEEGNLSSVQRTNNGKSQTYSITYDPFGNMTSLKIGDQTLATYTYGNGNGLLKSQTYANGDNVSFTYDDLGRVQSAFYSDGHNVLYFYDGNGRLYRALESTINYSRNYFYTYDSLGRLIYSEQKEGYSSVLRTNQNYNAFNQLTKQSWQLGSTAYSETYTYNASDGSLNTMTTGVGTTLTMGYDGLRRLTSVTGGPVSRQFTYRDIDSTKTTMQVASVTSGGQQYGYTYDSMGNIATYSAPGKGTVTYTYDNQGQLLSATGDTTYTYTYDGAGNILTANGHTYTYGDTTWKDLLTAFDGNSISYDAIGNPTSYYNGTRWTMTWTGGRNLTNAAAGGNSLSFAYNANGLRTSKTVNGVTYQYYYASGKLMRMTWGANTIDFFYDANGTPYAMKYNGTVYYYVTNLQGDVMRIVNASGTVMASYDYDPYGKVISATGTLANVNPLRYRGYVYDQETGFYYLQSRYYDPAIGRFINADSYASTGQDIIGYNMFAYCGNDPIFRIDYDGEGWGLILLTAAVLSCLLTSSENQTPHLQEEANDKYNSGNVEVYERGNSNINLKTVNAEIYYPNSTVSNISIGESLAIRSKYEQNAVLDVIIESPYYSEDVYGSKAFMRAQWVAHNVCYDIASSGDVGFRLMQLASGSSNPLESASSLDLRSLNNMLLRQKIMYTLISWVY